MNQFKFSLSLLVFLTCSSAGIYAQCSEYIAEDKVIDEQHQATTQPLTMVSRGTYQYTLEFIYDGKWITARVLSIGGVDLHQGDEVIIVDADGNRYIYPFINEGQASSVGGIPTHYNVFPLERTDLDWLAGRGISILYIKCNHISEIRKFAIAPEQQVEISRAAACFKQLIGTAEE